MKLFNIEFRPKLWATILMLIIVALFVRLGIWQLDRYHEKKTIQDSFTSRMNLPALPVMQIISQYQASEEALRFRPVTLTGTYDNHQFLWDNRIINNTPGFDVITPFKMQDGNVILVDRGFVPVNSQRQLMQAIDPPSQILSLQGLIDSPSKNFILGPIIEPDTKTWPFKIMRIEPSVLAKQLGYPILPYIVLLKPEAPYGYVRQWSPPNIMPEKSLGYAFQWFAFAMTLIAIYLVMSCKRTSS